MQKKLDTFLGNILKQNFREVNFFGAIYKNLKISNFS